jgi:hypothetical protein
MSLLFTALYTGIQPNLLAASKIKVVDRASNEFRPSVSANEFHLGLVGGGDKKEFEGGDGDDDDGFVAGLLAPTTNAKDATTRVVSVPKVAVNVKGTPTNTGRSPLPDSVKPFQVDAFDALQMFESGATLPTTGNNRKESKDAKPEDRKREKRQKQESKERPQRNKKAADNNRANTRDGGLPQVAWIMSFGGSVSESDALGKRIGRLALSYRQSYMH